MKHAKYLLLLALCLLLTACGPKPAEAVVLDLDYIADTLTASGYFPGPLEAQDPELVPGLLNLYEDRIEANPEDIAQARFTMCLGMVADQFLLLEGTDGEAADRLEKALTTYAEDQKSAYEFYAPDQAARMDDPIVERQGNYLLFAVGSDRDGLEKLCKDLIAGGKAEWFEPLPAETDPPAPDASEPDASEPDSSQPEPPAPLTDADKAAAEEAALDYYQGTVFVVDSLTEIGPRQGEIAFQVSCSKGGVRVDPDRTITLERQNGVWTVISEGY